MSVDIAKKAAKLAEKQAKLAAKQTKQVVAPVAGATKKEKAKKEEKVEEAFVNTTPKGEKKGEHIIAEAAKTAWLAETTSFPPCLRRLG